MTAFLFPGQGSQKRGMGQDLFDTVREFVAVEPEVNRILGYSLRRLCLDDTDNRLQQTQYTQPCLYVVNALHYYHAIATGARPQFVAGHSLGEYNALLAAGAFDFITGLRLVQKRGELMARAKNGGMGAVLGLDPTRIAALLEEHDLSGLDIANFNAPAQTVISGPVDQIQRAGPLLEQAGARLFMPLQVSAAFHSRYMAEAADAFADFIAPFSFSPLQLPVIANVTGEPYPDDRSGAAVRALLVRQITRSVQWTRSIRYLLDRGETRFEEIGPGKVLARLVQEIERAAAPAGTA
jgi:malonyl CoA-acyl carrier protein transacylase